MGSLDRPMKDLQLHTKPSVPVLPLSFPSFSLWLSKALPLQNPELKLQGWALPAQPPHTLSYCHLCKFPAPGG